MYSWLPVMPAIIASGVWPAQVAAPDGSALRPKYCWYSAFRSVDPVEGVALGAPLRLAYSGELKIALVTSCVDIPAKVCAPDGSTLRPKYC